MADRVPGLQIAVPVSAMLLEGRCKAQLPSQKECLYRCEKSDYHDTLAVACGAGSAIIFEGLPMRGSPQWIDRAIFHPQPSNLREKYHLEGKRIVLGVANTWNVRKGLPDLLTLAGRLGSDYQVVLIGLIEKQLPNIPSNVLGLLRTANQIELAQWYSTADVFVNPTYEETFGLTTVEAQACGTPVVVYETDGCPETVAPGNGRLIPQGDMQALENAVRDVADSNWRADPKKMVRFDKDTVYQGYVKLYENVLSTLKKGV